MDKIIGVLKFSPHTLEGITLSPLLTFAPGYTSGVGFTFGIPMARLDSSLEGGYTDATVFLPLPQPTWRSNPREFVDGEDLLDPGRLVYGSLPQNPTDPKPAIPTHHFATSWIVPSSTLSTPSNLEGIVCNYNVLDPRYKSTEEFKNPPLVSTGPFVFGMNRGAIDTINAKQANVSIDMQIESSAPSFLYENTTPQQLITTGYGLSPVELSSTTESVGYRFLAHPGRPWVAEDIGSMYMSMISKSNVDTIPDRRLHVVRGSLGILYEGDSSGYVKRSPAKMARRTFFSDQKETSQSAVSIEALSNFLRFNSAKNTDSTFTTSNGATGNTSNLYEIESIQGLTLSIYTGATGAGTPIVTQFLNFSTKLDVSFYRIESTQNASLCVSGYSVGLDTDQTLPMRPSIPVFTRGQCATFPRLTGINFVQSIFSYPAILPGSLGKDQTVTDGTESLVSAPRIMRHHFSSHSGAKANTLFNVDALDIAFPQASVGPAISQVSAPATDTVSAFSRIRNRSVEGLSAIAASCVLSGKLRNETLASASGNLSGETSATGLQYRPVVSMWDPVFGSRGGTAAIVTPNRPGGYRVVQFLRQQNGSYEYARTSISNSFSFIKQSSEPLSALASAEAARFLHTHFLEGVDNQLWTVPKGSLIEWGRKLRRYARLVETAARGTPSAPNGDHSPEWPGLEKEVIQKATNALWSAVSSALTIGVRPDFEHSEQAYIAYSSNALEYKKGEPVKPLTVASKKWQQFHYDRSYSEHIEEPYVADKLLWGGFTNQLSYELYRWAYVNPQLPNFGSQLCGIQAENYRQFGNHARLPWKNSHFSEYSQHHFSWGHIFYAAYVALRYGGAGISSEVLNFLTNPSPPTGTREPFPLLQALLDVVAMPGSSGKGVVAPSATDQTYRTFPPHRCFDPFEGRSYSTGVFSSKGQLTHRHSATEAIAAYEAAMFLLLEVTRRSGGQPPESLVGLVYDHNGFPAAAAVAAVSEATESTTSDGSSAHHATSSKTLSVTEEGFLTSNTVASGTYLLKSAVHERALYNMYTLAPSCMAGAADHRETHSIFIGATGTTSSVGFTGSVLFSEWKEYPPITSNTLITTIPKKNLLSKNLKAQSKTFLSDLILSANPIEEETTPLKTVSQCLNFVPALTFGGTTGTAFGPLSQYSETESYYTTLEWFKHFGTKLSTV